MWSGRTTDIVISCLHNDIGPNSISTLSKPRLLRIHNNKVIKFHLVYILGM